MVSELEGVEVITGVSVVEFFSGLPVLIMKALFPVQAETRFPIANRVIRNKLHRTFRP